MHCYLLIVLGCRVIKMPTNEGVVKDLVFCSKCGEPIYSKERKPCLKCGDTSRHFKTEVISIYDFKEGR